MEERKEKKDAAKRMKRASDRWAVDLLVSSTEATVFSKDVTSTGVSFGYATELSDAAARESPAFFKSTDSTASLPRLPLAEL